MGRVQYILILLLLMIVSKSVFATPQIPDYLVYKADTIPIYVHPLESYFDNHLRPTSVFEELGYNSTGCWRGYVAYWELINDKLYLTSISGKSNDIKLSLIFPDRKNDGKIFADWYNGSILNPYGKPLYYIHMGYDSFYEYEREFIFKNGLLTEIKKYDNSKSRRSKYTTERGVLSKYIRENINYNNISNDPYKKARVIVGIRRVTAAGKIDSVSILRGEDEERNREAIRVVKSIPEWDVIYRHGELYNMWWTLPVFFGKEEEKDSKQ